MISGEISASESRNYVATSLTQSICLVYEIAYYKM